MKSEDQLRQLREVVFSVLELLRFLSMYDALEVRECDKLNFFRVYGGTLMISSVIYWWRYFGNRKEASHWTNFVPPNQHNEFRQQLAEKLVGQPIDSMEELWTHVEPVRNRGFAHHDFDLDMRPQTYPFLGPMRATAEVLYSWGHQELESYGAESGLRQPMDIMGERRDLLVQHWRRICSIAREATTGIPDSPFDFQIDGVPISEVIKRIED